MISTCKGMPDFLIIGAMKSGSTSLSQILTSHPDIFIPPEKELQYFSRDHKFNQGEEYYRNFFKNASNCQLIGEASTCYSRWPHYPHATERIAKRLPNVKLIYLMRHPVERAYSHYGHLMQERTMYQTGDILTFEEMVEQDKEITNTSLYMMQINRYLTTFSQKQMLFLTLDELKSSPTIFFQRVQDFLGITPINLISRGTVKANPLGGNLTKESITNFVNISQKGQGWANIVGYIPKDTRLHIKEKLIKSRLLNFLFSNKATKFRKQLSPLTIEMRKKLLRQFKEPTQQLEEFLDWDLTEWYK